MPYVVNNKNYLHMKRSFTSLLSLTLLLLFSHVASSQTAGDYRTNVTVAPGLWSDISIWETYDGVSWIPAVAYPTSADGVITISGGDSVELDNMPVDPLVIDQVVVNGSLIIFEETVTLADGPGDDLTVNWKFSIGLNGELNGAGNVIVNSTATPAIQIRNGGELLVNTVVNGDMQFLNTGYIGGGANLVTNALTTWTSGNIIFRPGGGTFTNNGTVASISSSNDNMQLGPGVTFINAGILARTNAAGSLGLGVDVINTGAIAGIGIINFNTTLVNNGVIAPGEPIGTPLILTPNATTLFTATTDTQIQFGPTSTPPTTNSDLLIVNSAGATALNGTLTIADDPGAALGVYTIISTTGGGTLTGTFASVVKPSNFGNPVYTGTSVTIEKLSVVPVIWHSFNVLAANKKVQVSWKTLQESNTSHFEIEHSTNGTTYTSVGKVTASGNSPVISSYGFVHGNPDLTGKNYYRLKQVDLDGKFVYSEIRSLRFNEGRAAAVVALPNPVRDILQVAVQADNVSILITDLNGRIHKRMDLRQGNYQVNISSLPAGNYTIVVYEKKQRVASQQLIKL